MRNSILDGVDTIIDNWLALPNPEGQPPYYQHKSNLQTLMGLREDKPKERDGCLLCEEIYQKITSNWDSSRMSHSKQNWRWKRCPRIAVTPEVKLERRIIRLGDPNWVWVNQVPVASGLCGPGRDKRRCIDLVHRISPTTFEFIELKLTWKSGNPLFAAMEILQYGMLYLFTRCNLSSLTGNVAPPPNVLDAKEVHLRVLAPHKYYEATELGWIERIISVGVGKFSRQCGVRMNFRFDRFPHGFRLQSRRDILVQALQNIEPAFKSNGGKTQWKLHIDGCYRSGASTGTDSIDTDSAPCFSHRRIFCSLVS